MGNMYNDIIKDYFDNRLYTVKTDMCDMFTKHNSDKGSSHNYTTFYNHLFKSLGLLDKPINLFELGIGTNNISLKSNMGVNGTPGASLRAFKEYFPQSNIYGADIDNNILFEEERIKTFHCDQTSATSTRAMWNQIDKEFDIIIEDGLHETQANIAFLINSFRELKKGGVYIIEDILHPQEIESFLTLLNCDFSRVISIPIEPHRIDNTLAIIIK